MPVSLLPASPRDLDSPCPELLHALAFNYSDAAEGRAEIAAILSSFSAVERNPPWLSYWARCDESRAFAGLCGFKANLDQFGQVEIAYCTFPANLGRGIAKAMARRLVEIARHGGARLVLAHTLPVANASGSVLARSGFDRLGTVHDPEDGLVWRWRLLLS